MNTRQTYTHILLQKNSPTINMFTNNTLNAVIPKQIKEKDKIKQLRRQSIIEKEGKIHMI
jgi:hypothetical protein